MPEVPPFAGAGAVPVADRLEIHELLARYGHLLDERAFERLGEVFTPDVRYDATDFNRPLWKGLAAVIDGMREDTGHPVAHHSTNVILGAPEPDGSVRVLSKGPGVGRNGRVGSATYQDVVVPTADGWRVASRTVTLRRPEGMNGSGGSPLGRVWRLEAQAAIGQLPIRYALAVDGRDVDAWVALFTPDIALGRHGSGRAALRALIEPQLRWFYRSVHQIVGHQIEVLDHETAHGRVYCRAEHEVGDRWIVMAICYLDDYRQVGGDWLFSRRRELHWYAADVDRAPQRDGFDSWGVAGHPPTLPGAFPTWQEFWQGSDLSNLTSAPDPRP
jgi:hypothetical protein